MTSDELGNAVAEITLNMMYADGMKEPVTVTEYKVLQAVCPVCKKPLYATKIPHYPKGEMGLIFCKNSCLNDYMVWARYLNPTINTDDWVEEEIENFNTVVKDLAIKTYLPELWKEWLSPSKFTPRSDFRYTRDEMFRMAMEKREEEE